MRSPSFLAVLTNPRTVEVYAPDRRGAMTIRPLDERAIAPEG